jgi:hypothetical protein
MRAPATASAHFAVLVVTLVVTFTALADHGVAAAGDLRRDPW